MYDLYRDVKIYVYSIFKEGKLVSLKFDEEMGIFLFISLIFYIISVKPDIANKMILPENPFDCKFNITNSNLLPENFESNNASITFTVNDNPKEYTFKINIKENDINFDRMPKIIGNYKVIEGNLDLENSQIELV